MFANINKEMLIEIGISYDSDVDKAMQIIKEEALKHPMTWGALVAEGIRN